ncbi:hypothetical protein PG993_002165 [Apiospora rasikravindrae]|uniref:BHLH domain-containing protein n=1 Tax=Apiospora rasikravindrae TaxID=990691 RepID=A0ABR1UDG5_9PEZI
MPPTPNSTEMKGKDGVQQIAPMQMSFELPPSAIGGKDASRPTSSESKTSSPAASSLQPLDPRTPYPVQASEAVKSRRRSSVAQKEQFALPPPPTRSRKIIQMKPRAQEEVVEPPSPTTTAAAGAKERLPQPLLRRSNQLLQVLPEGRLHASIDYVRYLEDCVSKLKSQNESQSSARTPTEFALPPPISRNMYREDDMGDVEMTGSEAPSPTHTPSTSRSQRPSESPALLAEDVRHRQNSYSSVSTDHRHYSYSASTQASPAFGPQQYNYNLGTASTSNSTLTSPALPPLRDMDQEASAALLMLNTDRRGTSGSGAGRGMSVRDLLSA